MSAEPGDHFWHWNGRVSRTADIPRAQWFPGSTGPTDYLGHGWEIEHFVVYADRILRGQPHMRHGRGTFAWLNNNPGNITGRAGGPDYGQLPGTFSWHNFLIFPDAGTGSAAIATLLRGPDYAGLSILAAFRRYAPAADGNTPDVYARAVAKALGVSTSVPVGGLDDEQMAVVQEKIRQVEGSVPGDTLGLDSPELPEAVAAELIRTEAAPGPFDIDVSAPVDPSGFSRGYGGPGVGGHVSPHWYIQFGMDLGAAPGTPVYAAFDAHLTKFQPHDPSADTGKIYGAQLFMRSPNDGMGAFCTHITDTPDGLGPGSVVTRGDYLGTVYAFDGVSPHLHIALVELLGGAGGQYVGVDLYAFFLALEAGDPTAVVPVTFHQDSSTPTPWW